ncbi:TetR/AcrR family transcriptional regulator [Schauerella aestuarii]|uniref:TetR/AcrR family transcriptional regulator n=1 Tax=Schauerella aestuarii TaxID=2511204 RepID=UPI00136EF83A|nr:TetR/AcrR family transcriptional regulator [Achromobacter aestuarii]MYZ45595.1 TetR/AcrR family transcriptional regulator [Achromobacter aestuarii]
MLIFLTRIFQRSSNMPNPSLEPRKAPRQARSQATHDAILQAATQLLSCDGLKGFNTNAIAARAGTSVGSLYQYFPNKDALMLALIHRQKMRMLNDMAQAIRAAPHDDLEAAVRILIGAVIKHSREDGLLASAIDHEEARLPIGDVIASYLQQGSDLCLQFFSQCRELDGLDHRRAARTVPVIIQAIMDHWTASGGLRTAPEPRTADAENGAEGNAAGAEKDDEKGAEVDLEQDVLAVAEHEVVQAVLGYLRYRSAAG